MFSRGMVGGVGGVADAAMSVASHMRIGANELELRNAESSLSIWSKDASAAGLLGENIVSVARHFARRSFLPTMIGETGTGGGAGSPLMTA